MMNFYNLNIPFMQYWSRNVNPLINTYFKKKPFNGPRLH